MKRIFLFLLFNSVVGTLLAQTETFDLITFTPPKGWTKEEKQNVIVYTTINEKDKTWCQIGVYKSTASKGNIDDDLKSEWNEVAAKQYSITEPMEPTQT